MLDDGGKMTSKPEGIDFTKHNGTGDVTPDGYDAHAPEAGDVTPPGYNVPAPSYAPQGTPAGYNNAPVDNPYAVPGNDGYANPQGYNASQSPYGVPQDQGQYTVPSGHAVSNGSNDFFANWKRPDNLAVIYGSASIVMFFLSFAFALFGLVGFVAGILGLVEVSKAKKFAMDVTLGRVLSWIGTVLSCLGLILLFILFLFAALLFSVS